MPSMKIIFKDKKKKTERNWILSLYDKAVRLSAFILLFFFIVLWLITAHLFITNGMDDAL